MTPSFRIFGEYYGVHRVITIDDELTRSKPVGLFVFKIQFISNQMNTKCRFDIELIVNKMQKRTKGG